MNPIETLSSWAKQREDAGEDPVQITRVLLHELASYEPCAEPTTLAGDPRWDALIAAAVARKFHLARIPSPSWTNVAAVFPAWSPHNDLIRDDDWFRLTILRTPVEFLHRGVILDRINLENL